MSSVGSWGDLVFSVSPQQVRTFNNMKWDCGARFATHNRHLKQSLLEYVGADVETITFTMTFSAFLGLNPMDELAKLLSASRNGKTARLAIGNVGFGTYQWALTKISNDMKLFDKDGTLLAVEVNVTMQSYPRR